MAGSDFLRLLSNLGTKTAECVKHGTFESVGYNVPGATETRFTDCPVCEQERIEQETKAMVLQVQKDAAKARAEALLGRAAIPPRFLSRSLDNFSTENEGQQRALSSAKRYADNWHENKTNGTSLIMCGAHGTGKTHLAIGIARHVIEAGDSAVFVSVIDMVRAVKETYSRNSERTERQVIADFARPDLLILDEIGRQHGTDTERLIIFDVINARYLQNKPSILITNLTLPELGQALDEATQDRLREGGGRAIQFDWASYRSRV